MIPPTWEKEYGQSQIHPKLPIAKASPRERDNTVMGSCAMALSISLIFSSHISHSTQRSLTEDVALQGGIMIAG